MSISDSSTPAPSEPRKRRRWPWIVLLIGIAGTGLLWKLKSDAIADRERLRVWKAEAESHGLFCAKVTFGRAYGDPLSYLDFLLRDKIAVSVTDETSRILLEIKSPAPSGLILVDEGLSSDVAAELQRRFPGISMPRITPPPMPAAGGAIPAAQMASGSP